MPVKIGDNLQLNNNNLSALYNELYNKLNKAYAWEHTDIISSNYSAIMMKNSGNIMNIQAIKEYNTEPYLYDSGGSDSYLGYMIINGEAYDNTLNKIGGSKSNYKEITKYYILDEDGYIYDTSGNKINNNIIINKISLRSGTMGMGITSSGQLYLNITNTSPTLYDGGSTGWTECCNEYSGTYYALQNGVIYCVVNQTKKIVFPNVNNFVKFYSNDNYVVGLTDDGKVYYTTNGNVSTPNYNLCYDNIMTIFPTNSGDNFIGMTYDGELYYCPVSLSTVNPVFITSGINFTSMTKSNSENFYGIGDNKLYYIRVNSSSSSITLLDKNHYYIKIIGNETYQVASRIETEPVIGDKKIRYTCKYSEIGDKLYVDTIPSSYETILDKTSTTLLSSGYGLTYTRDVTLDSSFEKVLEDYRGKTLTVDDFLRITNPNS